MDPPEPHQHDAAVDHHHHDAAADHDHAEHRAPTHRRLVVLGLAGGLVPSPSAVVVLLAGIALGKPILAVALVIAYGVGMAGVLAGAGILVLRARGLVERRLGEGGISGPLAILARAMPMAAAFIVVVAGAILVTRSIGLL
jgi:ABC-type nickel/cobalt efflux system permease component RcnA